MEPRARESGGDRFQVRVCPECGGRDTIRYQKVTDVQADLFGNESEVYTRLRSPVCARCGKVFEKGEKFGEERRRL